MGGKIIFGLGYTDLVVIRLKQIADSLPDRSVRSADGGRFIMRRMCFAIISHRQQLFDHVLILVRKCFAHAIFDHCVPSLG